MAALQIGSEGVGTDGVNGRVGIGTMSPEAELEVNGSIKLSGTDEESDSNAIVFGDNGQIKSHDDNHKIIFNRENNLMEFQEYGDIALTPGGSSGVGIGTTTPGSKLTVQGCDTSSGNSTLNATDSNGNSLLFVQNDGKIGVGTTSPGEKLEVAGNVKSSGGQIMIGNVRIGIASTGPTGAEWKFKGSLYINTTTGKLYINTASDGAGPTWTLVGSQT